ncbi:DUF2306 domain-containing protein [Lysobacter sp. S4-A87]|uniref:DUF2306 domain-containing protein n=1 Tax=Lysobacter sp. S4-A87 TaxID=2925843 RepID=UPI001F530CBB|nr:DUF2306 domain-containing protein [Lysobacter sp. S4-A87]UNK48004.1 DUF2306 domain-containing protein [Lysobacter sp. S4-A87]
MNRGWQRFGSTALRWTMALAFVALCLAVSAYAFTYVYLPHGPGDQMAAKFALSGLDVPAHFFGAGLALLLAPLQMSNRIRQVVPRLHRLSGGLYTGGVLFGGLGGLSLSTHATGGAASGVGFALLAVAWLTTTGIGIGYAIGGDLIRHRRWMARSIALTASAITLRLTLGVGLGALHLPFLAVYIFAAWSCWTINLALCELWLHWPAIRARLMATGSLSRAGVGHG